MKVQVALIPNDGSAPTVLSGDPACMSDPCALHQRCHCMCPCDPDGDNNCADCAGQFGDEPSATSWTWIGIGSTTD